MYSGKGVRYSPADALLYIYHRTLIVTDRTESRTNTIFLLLKEGVCYSPAGALLYIYIHLTHLPPGELNVPEATQSLMPELSDLSSVALAKEEGDSITYALCLVPYA